MPLGGALTVGSAALGVASGVAQFIDASKDEKKAKEELGKLKPAYYNIQDEYFQNQNLAKAQAGQGMTSAAKDYVTTETQRGLGSSIGAISSSGGSPNDVAKLFDVYRRSVNSTAAQDSQMQQENIQRLMAVNKDLAGQKTIQWSVNEYQPYQNKLKELTQRRAAAEQNKWSGVQTAVGSIGAAGTALQNQSLVDAQNQRPQQQQATAPAPPNMPSVDLSGVDIGVSYPQMNQIQGLGVNEQQGINQWSQYLSGLLPQNRPQ